MQILSEFPNVATLREKIITAREVINSVSASENCNAAYLAKQLDISQDFAQIIFIHSTSKCSTT